MMMQHSKAAMPPPPCGTGLGEAPLPAGLDLDELSENLIEGKLVGGIHGGIPKSTALIPDVSNPTGIALRYLIQVQGTE
jgi:hypothetical protein